MGIHLRKFTLYNDLNFIPEGEYLMTAKLCPSAQQFQDHLAARGYPNQVVEMPASTRTSAEAAAAIGCTVAQIAKSIIFRSESEGSDCAVMVVASGINRVDEKKVLVLIGSAVQKADADFVRQQTGYAIGGVPPTGHTRPVKILIDEDLMQYCEIWAAAGTPFAVFKLTPSQLVEITAGTVANTRVE
jgi:prolyl-tRNA editing enzyme YbaK/EbsC (Cys-tRNA(Pro) deacylase)